MTSALVAPEHAAKVSASLDGWRTGLLSPVVYRALRANGSALWIESEGKRVSDGSGLIVVSRDVSKLKDAEAKLAEANLRLDTALNNMDQGLVMYDRDERLIVFNARYCELYGLPPERLSQGMSFRDVIKVYVDEGRFPGRTVMRSMPNAWRSCAKGGRQSSRIVPTTAALSRSWSS